MTNIRWNRIPKLLTVAGLAAVAPNAFPVAQMGYYSLHDLALYAILPAALILVLVAAASGRIGSGQTAAVVTAGAIAGAGATVALEAIRYPGFLLGFMPGNLPELMGVLLLDQFAEGPSTASSIAGFSYHAWNGSSFGIIFMVLVSARIIPLRAAWTVAYGLLIGIGFLASPVVQSLGGGMFGVEFGWKFAATVLTAHAAFGLALWRLLWMTAPHKMTAADRADLGHTALPSSAR